MPKLKQLKENLFVFTCPGCGHDHEMPVNGAKNYSGATWTFNDNIVAPTFTPSIDFKWGKYVDPSFEDFAPNSSGRCHSVVTDGKIQFLNDCTHQYAGQTLDLIEIE